MKKTVYIALGTLMVGLGFIGVVLPILPTTPFLLLASYLFAAESETFNQWLSNLPIYRKHVEPFANDRSMTLRTKWSILLPASSMLLLSMFIVPSIWARVFILIILITKYVYFFTQIKTIPRLSSTSSSNGVLDIRIKN